MDASTVLASAEDRVIDEAVATLTQRDQTRQSPRPDERRRDVRQLFRLVLRCVHAGRAEAIIRPSEQTAAHCYAAGIDLSEEQGTFNALAEVLWRRLAGALAGEQLVQALALLNAIVAAAKDAMPGPTWSWPSVTAMGRVSSQRRAQARQAPAPRAMRVTWS